MTTLYERMRDTLEYRKYHGMETDARVMRTWLEHAVDTGYEKRLPLSLDRYNDMFTPRWFTPGPDMGAVSDWSAWLNPQGQWYYFSYANHYNFSSSAFGSNMGGNSYLEQRGWLHVSGGKAYVYYTVTPRQQRAMDALDGVKALRTVELNPKDEGFPQFPISLDTEEGTDEQIARIRAFSRMPIPNYKWDDPKYWPNPEHGHPAVLAALNSHNPDTLGEGLRIPTWDIEANAMRWQPAA